MGKVCLHPTVYSFDGRTVFYPCGKCPACRDLARMEIAARFLLEKAVHPEYDTFFLTLTYDEDHRPQGFRKDHIDGFLQALRNKTRTWFGLRYLLVCEYGDLDQREHYHFIVHTTKKIDDISVYRSSDGHKMRCNYFVDAVRRSWPYGYIDDGYTPGAAAVLYTTGYALKEDQFTLDHEDDLSRLRWCSQHHIKPPKELRKLQPLIPFRRFSLRPGIGLDEKTVTWVYRYMYNDGVHYRFNIDLGSGFVVPVPGIYLDKFVTMDIDPVFSYICKCIRKSKFDNDYQTELDQSFDRSPDGALARRVRELRIKKRRDDKISKALSQSLNIYRNEF